jgi:hypothetical protein
MTQEKTFLCEECNLWRTPSCCPGCKIFPKENNAPIKEALPTSEELEALRQHMLDIATRLDYFGGLSEWADHGAQLAGAAGVMSTWVDGMKEREAGK